MFETVVRDGVCRLWRPGTRWLSTGFDGGQSRGPVAYNVTVPEGWSETELSAYVDRRLDRAGFDQRGPALLTGVDQRHARRARYGGCEAVVTAGLSNPAVLPVDPGGDGSDERGRTAAPEASAGRSVSDDPDRPPSPGTVNVFLGTTRALSAGAFANLLTVAAEAKAATLTAVAGVPGTTSDAVVVADDPDGEPAAFSGSATAVGRAARACVRDALLASLASRYPDGEFPRSLADAAYGVSTDVVATVTDPSA
jgi:adenosylcobinamide hydrolase